MDDLYVTQGTDKIKYYVGHIRTKSDTSDLLKIEKDYMELVIGRGKCPLRNPEINEDAWAPKTWIQQLGSFLQECDGYIESEGKRLIHNQR